MAFKIFQMNTIKAKLKHFLMVVRNCSILLAKGDFAAIWMHTQNRINRHKAARKMNISGGDRITIAATPHTLFLAYLMCRELTMAGFATDVIIGPGKKKFGSHLHFVFCPQMFKKLPRLYFAVQMEQSVSSRWFNEEYFKKLSEALAILDYSKKNIEYLLSKNIPYSRIYYLPVSHFQNYRNYIGLGNNVISNADKEYDVVFYGDIRNSRRASMLNEIGKRFKLLIINDLFGVELYKKLLTARTVVNIHYYENALLETTRIYECLSLGLSIVSEKGADHNEHKNLHDLVHFVDEGDSHALINSLQLALSSPTCDVKKLPDSIYEPTQDNNEFSFYFNRLLLAYDLIDFSYFNARFSCFGEVKDSRKCLSLTETVSRKITFEQQYAGSFEVVEGLRHRFGWIGCALSYKYYAYRSLKNGDHHLLMCEDDVVLPNNYQDRLDIVQRYLRKKHGSWDVFSGIIAHLNKDTEVLGIDVFEGIEFITLNRMTSTVFNIYGIKALQLLANWDQLDRTITSNTIDRYLESAGLRIITTLPFLAGHDEMASSTLWGFSNTEYNSFIANSESLLRKKVEQFKELQYQDVTN